MKLITMNRVSSQLEIATTRTSEAEIRHALYVEPSLFFMRFENMVLKFIMAAQLLFF